MRFIVPAISLVGLIGPAICQTSPPLAQPNIREQVRIDSFQSSKRSDNYGIASFIISNATEESDYGALFRVTETYRAGAEGQQKTSALLHAFASLLEDLLLLHAGTGHLIRNIDLQTELTRMSQTIDVGWIETAVRALDQVEQGMRRNLLRSLSLDSFAAGLSRK